MTNEELNVNAVFLRLQRRVITVISPRRSATTAEPGKKIVLFATSGSSGFGNTVSELQPSAPGAELVETNVLSGIITEAKIKSLIDLCS